MGGGNSLFLGKVLGSISFSVDKSYFQLLIQPLRGCKLMMHSLPALYAGLFEFNPFGLLPSSRYAASIKG
jgi:hypothetical protein